ncbi:MAG: DUF58 domain-containing protein [Acetobacteraceae bacterium]|nr:DUF58 domain-containing protein [Acetobacteraceae bacterium]
MQGVHGRRRSGQGDAFWQFRPFVTGDVPARIDWRQSAKSDRLFIRETEWEAAQTVALWRDASPSMAWRSGPAVPPKRERAELLLLATASLLLRGGEQVRLIGDPGRNHTGHAGLEAVANALGHKARMAPAQGGGTAAEPGVPPDDPALPRHARAVLFGDFLSPLDEIRRSVSALAARPLRGHLVQILDPAEETLPYRGRIRFEGLEAEAPSLVPRVENVRELYEERLHLHRAGVAAIAAAAGWGFLTHRTDQPSGQVLLALWQALAPQ